MSHPLVAFVFVLGVVELLIVSYYANFEPERLYFEMAIAAAIATVAAVPTIWYFQRQHKRLAALSRQLVYLSTTDQMTGLLNRPSFLKEVEKLLQSLPADSAGGAFAYIDADHFKQINDRYGHAVGDDTIRYIARHIRAAARPNDLCGRLGGEEFAMFLTGESNVSAGRIAEQLRKRIVQQAAFSDLDVDNVSVSIGVAAHQPGQTAAQVIREADRNLYAAKNSGRNSVAVELKIYCAA
jgi:diguanylate cyclase